MSEKDKLYGTVISANSTDTSGMLWIMGDDNREYMCNFSKIINTESNNIAKKITNKTRVEYTLNDKGINTVKVLNEE